MSLLISSSRRRKLLFAAAAIAAGGYASYRIYTSSALARRRKRLLQLLSTLSFCCDAVYQSAESISILSSDIKSFLLSDDDAVPQSLKQAFKVGQSEEFQDSITVLSAALTRGLLQGVNAKQKKEGHVRGHGQGRGQQPVKRGFQAWQVKDADVSSQELACREIREVCFTDKSPEQPRSHGCEHDKEHILLSNAEKGGSDWEIKSYSSGSDMHLRRSRKVGIVLDRSRRGKASEDLLDKLLSKLLSEAGVGFASAVAGTLARNLVLSFFEATRKQNSSTQDPSSASSANGPLRTLETTQERTPSYAKIIDVMGTNSCRMLIAECIQTFIATAVTVYVDKTKDVNFYDDMVAGITNPSHRDPMKDMLTSVCNSAIETLVKTSYGVMVAENNGQKGLVDSHQQSGKNQWRFQECSPLCMQGQLSSSMEANCTQMEDLTSDEQSDSQATSIANTRVSVGRLQGNSTGGVQSFIDGVSKTLAIPSNYKLVVDVAGTMTSEAVKSFVDVVVSTASSHISSKMRGSWVRVKRCVSGQQGLQLQERSRDMAAKAFILASVCLAICLHMLTGFQILQKL